MNYRGIYDLPWVREALAEPLDKNDVLFRHVNAGQGRQGDWKANAKVVEADDFDYQEGYRYAGRILADHIIEGERESFLVFPIVFLYRHYVELQFKRLIPEGAFLFNRSLSVQDRALLAKSHRLDQLWELLKPILQSASLKTDDIEAIDSYVRQIHAMDELSFSFRYPTTTTGEPSIDKKKPPYINIGVFAKCMERLPSYLYGLGEMFREWYQVKCEMEAEARSQYYADMSSFEPDYYGGYE
jgi:hypothetical protein